ncbi:keratin-associated protein 10-2-like [Sesbania bispinosa]|nr:keratin-associated protein 10-2-like [Sesbania bispinosa]
MLVMGTHDLTGVTSVSLEGDDKDRISVTGDNVDTVCLANQLKKKFRCVIILSVEEHVVLFSVKHAPSVTAQVAMSPKCHGHCHPCTKCESHKCDGKCVIICFKCQSPKCGGECKPCSKCQNSKCPGQCPCPNCHNNKCNGCKPCNKPPPSPYFRPCPPWCTCPRCYVPYPSPCPPYPCRVVYDPYPDSCSIM